jgi:hypothetical protein
LEYYWRYGFVYYVLDMLIPLLAIGGYACARCY